MKWCQYYLQMVLCPEESEGFVGFMRCLGSTRGFPAKFIVGDIFDSRGKIIKDNLAMAPQFRFCVEVTTLLPEGDGVAMYGTMQDDLPPGVLPGTYRVFFCRGRFSSALPHEMFKDEDVRPELLPKYYEEE